MESQVSCHEESNLPEDVFIKDVITSETHHVASNQPEKKQTRKWAAWTRQEEESFFNALRQVGKNFEKITFRVQSKNKDQVRHYYYRLVRRMNKLLGPELSLDAKNSKDTNAAMLRWWSLLEKHSCKASKLHLKPRRFKIFLETLENQLLKDRKHQLSKDRKKNATKQASQGENCCIGDLSPVKQTKKRRRSAAYKKWEKAAIAGVSLVADAAAHLEQTALDKLVDSVQDMPGDKVPKDVPPVPAFHQHEKNIQSMTKLKLQLFPINESIRRALETENHNPHLELTLSSRKKISSVLEHMNKKWGSCSIATGELILVPYYAQSLNVMSCHKWSQSSVLSAGDVYAAVGSPPVFRLRYGWFANSVPPQELHKSGGLSVFEWADSLTNVSVSDLLSDNVNPPPGSTQCVAFSCDSFDAAIAAHFSKNVGDKAVQPTVVSSIWGDEETCDAFTFHKNNVREKAETCKEDTAMSLVPSSSAIKKVAEAEVEPMNECQSDVKRKDSSPKDLHALTDIYWPDSLGGLEVEVGPCRYGSNELILSESLGGLSRILSSSLDAFQNSCFFGTTTLGDHKIDI